MPRPTHRLAVLAGVTTLLLGACGPVQSGQGAATPARQGSAIVIEGDQLPARGGGLLEGLRGRVGSLSIERRSGSCPQVSFRGVKTFRGATSAGVYIDGTPMTDTCVLDQIRIPDVHRVEIYPGGSTSRPGYRANPNGLILVFLTGRAG
jgi:hypothetical protein